MPWLSRKYRRIQEGRLPCGPPRRGSFFFFAGLAALVLSLSSANAPAQSGPTPPTSEQKQAAAKAFDQGEKAYTQGRYADAGAAFEEAFRHVPHPAALWNAARAYKRGGELVRAANVYALYLEKAEPDAPDRKSAQSDLDQLSKKLGRLEIFGPDAQDVRVDNTPARTGLVYVTPGTHVIAARVGDQDLQRVQSVDAGAAAHVALVAENTAPKTPSTPAQAPDASESTSSSSKNLRVLPPAAVYGGAGASALALGLTIGFGVDTLNARDEFDRSPTPEKLDEGRSKQTITNVLLGTTIALGALTGAAAIFFVDWKGKNGRALKAGLSPSGIALRGQYE